jgi:hypothetical protein
MSRPGFTGTALLVGLIDYASGLPKLSWMQFVGFGAAATLHQSSNTVSIL